MYNEKADILISVIMPISNGEKYLEESLRGVMNQTLKDIEIICVDDGSTDSTSEILLKLAAKDSRIKIITQVKKNAGAARNRGFSEARGKYVSFLDADDIFESDMLEEAFNTAEGSKAEIVVYRSDRYNDISGFFEEATWTIKTKLLPEKTVFSHSDMNDIYRCFIGWAWDKLFLRETIINSGLSFQEQNSINDMFFVFGMLAYAERVSVLDKVLVHKRINNRRSITSNYKGLENSEDLYNALADLKQYLINRRLYEDMKPEYINAAIYYVIWNLDRNLTGDDFEEIFRLTRECYIPDLIGNVDDDYLKTVPDLKTEFRNLLRKNAAEYRWNRQLCYKDGSYLFPFEQVTKGSRIILYGAGKVGRSFYRQIMFSGWCEIAAWVDMRFEGREEISEPMSAIEKGDFEIIVIAVNDELLAEEIRQHLLHTRAAGKQIIWRKAEIELQKSLYE